MAVHPALRAIGRSRQHRARPGFVDHTHDIFEICLIRKGSVDWWVEDQVHHVEAGSVYVTRPHEWHGCAAHILQPCDLCWLQVDPERLGEAETQERLWNLEGHVLPGAETALIHFERILAECRSPRTDSRTVVQASLLLLISGILRSGAGAGKSDQQSILETARLGVAEEPDLSVQALASKCGMSRSRLHTTFVSRFGVSPKQYLMEQRLRASGEELAESSKSITDIAFEYGFSSSQHFSTAFRHYFGMPPNRFRRERFL